MKNLIKKSQQLNANLYKWSGFVLVLFMSITSSYGQWYTNGSSRVYTPDRTGIGTSSPNHKLHIRPSGWDGIFLQGNNSADIWLSLDNGGGRHYIFDDDSDGHNLKLESANSLVFNTSGPRERMRITRAGRVGIGTANPAFSLDVNGNARVKWFYPSWIRMGGNTDGSAWRLGVTGNMIHRGGIASFGRNAGDIVTVGPMPSNGWSDFFQFNVNGKARASWFYSDLVRIGGNTDGTAWKFGINGNIIHRDGIVSLARNNTGRVTIGEIPTQDWPDEYKLAVNGSIICREVRVQVTENWPDYVFQSNYNLMPLNEVAEYIDTEKHLPGIPAATEIENNGLSMGEMQRKMMEKIEELMLYTLQQQQEIQELKRKLEDK